MQFTDAAFLIGFLPVVLILYQIIASRGTKAANVFLVIASLLFYACGSLYSLFVLVFILLWNFVCVKGLIETEGTLQQIQLWVCIAVDLLVMLVYKYPGTSLLVPMGLSFYIFSCLSYVFDVYRDKAGPCSLLDFALFAAFFGRVNMGPVGHYAQFHDQLDHHPVKRGMRSQGAALFLQGLGYKVILADNFRVVFTALLENTTWLGSLLAGFAYFFELYFDFAGYSRMARGLGYLFGFEIPKNFDAPYQAATVQQFWRRWHISLTKWFTNYVYIPLGGSRVSHTRWIINILIVWLLTGLWHGTTLPFIIWGLYQAALLLAEKAKVRQWLDKAPDWVGHVYVVITQLIGWTFFSSSSLWMAICRIGRYFFLGITALADSSSLFYARTYFVLFAAGIFCCTNGLEWIRKKVPHHQWQQLQIAGYGVLMLVCFAMLISQTARTFLYAAF